MIRFSDFLVNEVDKQGKVVSLTQLEPLAPTIKPLADSDQVQSLNAFLTT